MFLGISSRCRYHCCAQVLHSIMCTETTCKQTISVTYRKCIVTCNSECSQTAGHHLRPHGEILTGISYDGGVACSTGRCMYAHNFRRRCCLKPIGIIVTQVLFGRERKFHDVVDCHDIFRRYIHLLHPVSVERYIMIYILHQFLKVRSCWASYSSFEIIISKKR